MLLKQNRLTKNFQYRYVYKHGATVPCKHFMLIYVASKSKTSKFGISVSNKIGKAVLRNFIKRRLREGLRLLSPEIKGGFSCVITANPNYSFSLTSPTFSELSASLRYVFKKAGLIKDGGEA